MQLKKLMLMLVLSAVIAVPGNPVRAQQDGWEVVGDGVEYEEIILDGPVRAFVARMARSNPNVTLESALAEGFLVANWKRTSQMAAHYDDALNNWPFYDASGKRWIWGQRNKVVVAINGTFIDENTFQADGGVLQSGWYAKRFNEYSGGFYWTDKREPAIATCVRHIPDRQKLKIAGDSRNIDGINRVRGENELIVYTPQYYRHTRTDNSGIEVLVEMLEPMGIVQIGTQVVDGIVRAVYDGRGSTYIPFDHIVLSARGSAAEWLRSRAVVGEPIGINQEITNDLNCDPDNSNISWVKSYAGINYANYVYLRNGKIFRYDGNAGAEARHPRTAIAYDANYVYFIVVDGRREGWSIGMTIEELGIFTRDHLGANWGMALDGGGTSTMVVNGEVVNWPSQSCGESYKTYLPNVVQSKPPGSPPVILPPPEGGQSPVCQRGTKNAFMMVELVPPVWSLTYLSNGPVFVETVAQVELRLGPGWNYAAYPGLIEYGAHGEILDHINDLEGIYAKGAYWWKVRFGDREGWVPEHALKPVEEVLKLPKIDWILTELNTPH